MQKEAPQIKASKNENVKNELTPMEAETQNVKATSSVTQQMHKTANNGKHGLIGKVTPYKRKLQKEQDQKTVDSQMQTGVANTATIKKKLCKENFVIKEKKEEIKKAVKTTKQKRDRKRKLDGQEK